MPIFTDVPWDVDVDVVGMIILKVIFVMDRLLRLQRFRGL